MYYNVMCVCVCVCMYVCMYVCMTGLLCIGCLCVQLGVIVRRYLKAYNNSYQLR